MYTLNSPCLHLARMQSALTFPSARNSPLQFSFPLMKVNEIKDCLNALDIKVTEAQVGEPIVCCVLRRVTTGYLIQRLRVCYMPYVQ